VTAGGKNQGRKTEKGGRDTKGHKSAQKKVADEVVLGAMGNNDIKLSKKSLPKYYGARGHLGRGKVSTRTRGAETTQVD